VRARPDLAAAAAAVSTAHVAVFLLAVRSSERVRIVPKEGRSGLRLDDAGHRHFFQLPVPQPPPLDLLPCDDEALGLRSEQGIDVIGSVHRVERLAGVLRRT